MKTIIDYILESKGMSVYDRDGSHGKYEDPLIGKRNSRSDRANQLRNDKAKAKHDELISNCNKYMQEIEDKTNFDEGFYKKLKTYYL